MNKRIVERLALLANQLDLKGLGEEANSIDRIISAAIPPDVVSEWETIRAISKKTLSSFPVDNFKITSFEEDNTIKYLVKAIGKPGTQEMWYTTDGKGYQMLILVGGDEFGTHEEERTFLEAVDKAFPNLVFEVE